MYRSKFLTLAAASAVALSLAACGGSDDDSDTTSGGTGAASPGGGAEGASITLMVGVKGDPFYVSMECGAQEAADAAGATLEVQGPDKFDATLQNPMLDAVAAQQPDALLVAPNDVTASAPPLKRIQDAGTTGRARRHHRHRPRPSESRGSPPTTTWAVRRRPRPLSSSASRARCW